MVLHGDAAATCHHSKRSLMPHTSRAVICACTLACGSILASGCSDLTRVGEPTAVRVATAPLRLNEAIEQFPEPAEHISAIRLAERVDALPVEPDEAELVRRVTSAGGRVFIGLKNPSAPHSRRAALSEAITRAQVISARAQLEASGVVITQTFRNLPVIAALITPERAATLRRLPIVDYVEARSIAVPAQLPPPQDTTWGIKHVWAYEVWGGAYGLPVRGEYVNVTIIDTGLDSLHRVSSTGDGPANSSDCLWVAGTGSNSCYDDRNLVNFRGHGAHMAGIIAARDNPTE